MTEAKCIDATNYTYWMFVDDGYEVRRKKDGKVHWFAADSFGRAQHAKLWRGSNDEQAKQNLEKFAKSIREWRNAA